MENCMRFPIEEKRAWIEKEFSLGTFQFMHLTGESSPNKKFAGDAKEKQMWWRFYTTTAEYDQLDGEGYRFVLQCMGNKHEIQHLLLHGGHSEGEINDRQ